MRWASCWRRKEGKTLPEATGETVRAGRIFKYMAGEALRRHGQNLDSVRPGVEIQTYREAVGVYGLITPWNFPHRHPGLEDRSRPGLRQHRGAEVRQPHPGGGACAGFDHP